MSDLRCLFRNFKSSIIVSLFPLITNTNLPSIELATDNGSRCNDAPYKRSEPLSTKRISVNKDVFYFPNVCEETYNIVTNRLQKNGNKFTFKISSNVPFVFSSDQRKIVQLVINSILFLNSHICDAIISLLVQYDSSKKIMKLIFGIVNAEGEYYEKLQEIISRAAAIDLILFMTKSFSNAVAFKLLDILKGSVELEIPETTDELQTVTNVIMSIPISCASDSLEKHVVKLIAMKILRRYKWFICTNNKGSRTYNNIMSLVKEYDVTDYQMIDSVSAFRSKEKQNRCIIIIDVDHFGDVRKFKSLHDIGKYLDEYKKCIMSVLYVSEKKRKLKRQSSLTDLNVATSKSSKKYILRELLKQLTYHSFF